MWMNVLYGCMIATIIGLVATKIIKGLLAKLPLDPDAELEVSTLALDDNEVAGICFFCECESTKQSLSGSGKYICRECSLK